MRFPLLLAAAVLAAASARRGLAQAEAPATDAQLLAAHWNALGARLLSSAGPPDANTCLAPASVALALLPLAAGARGETATELRFLLAPADWDGARMDAAAKDLRTSLRTAAEGAPLFVATDVWAQVGAPLREDWLRTARDAHGAGVHRLDFARDPAAARGAIDANLAASARGGAAARVPEDLVHARTRLVVTNTTGFRAEWKCSLPEYRTEDARFTRARGEVVKVPFMHLEAELPLAEDDEVQVLRLHYRDLAWCLDVALPRAGRTLAAAEAALRALRTAPAARRVDVAMPRFRCKTELRLAATLRAAGCARAFGDAADFTGIDAGALRLRLEDVMHAVRIDVTEKGTEALGETIGGTALGIAPRPPATAFVADRPFAFALRHVPTGLLLFVGRVEDPREK